MAEHPPPFDPEDSTTAAWVAAANSSCWCAEARRRCTYHEGYEDGYEAAVAAFGSGASTPVENGAPDVP